MQSLQLAVTECFSDNEPVLRLIGYRYYVVSEENKKHLIYETVNLEQPTDYDFHTKVARDLYSGFINEIHAQKNNKKYKI
jgi:hypothetical protein